MTDDIELLQRAVADNPGEDVPLLMLADAYRERGEDGLAHMATTELEMRKVVREVGAVFETMAKQMYPALEAVAKCPAWGEIIASVANWNAALEERIEWPT